MEYIRIKGGRPLKGETKVQSSKNAALPIMAGAILAKGTTVLEKCPRITDVVHMIEIMENLGCKVWWEDENLCIDTTQLNETDICCQAAGRMRSSCLFLGCLIGRTKKAVLPYPGGCVIGKRPIDLHVYGLQCLGVVFEETKEKITARAKKLEGAVISLPYPSVGATENIILAAVLADGVTQIKGCAKEPEVLELCCFLNKMGAKIEWESSDSLFIKGVKTLQPVQYQIMADRIVAGTYLLAAAATRGSIVLRNTPWNYLGALETQLLKMGGKVRVFGRDVIFDGTKAVHGLDYVKTLPYPEFPTDLQPQLAAALVLADTPSIIEETVFESRFAAMGELNRMQAKIWIEDKRIHIHPVGNLKGTKVHAGDLRGGAALVAAGLAAEGITEVTGCEFLERGYVDIVKDFTALGGELKKMNNIRR